MTVDELISGTLSSVIPIDNIKPQVYTGVSDKYIIYTYYTNPENFEDDRPYSEKYAIQIKLICPLNYDTVELCKSIKRLLFEAGFTYPTMVDLSDDGGQMWLFECDYFTGIEGG